MAIESAGLLVFRKRNGTTEVLLAHPGGPFWAKKDTWSVPKGEREAGEQLAETARREFNEETNLPVPEGTWIELGSGKSSGGKVNYLWAIQASPDISNFKSNTFTMEWPPKSGKEQEFPEHDRLQWFTLTEAYTKVYGYLQVFLDRLAEYIGEDVRPPEQQSLL